MLCQDSAGFANTRPNAAGYGQEVPGNAAYGTQCNQSQFKPINNSISAQTSRRGEDGQTRARAPSLLGSFSGITLFCFNVKPHPMQSEQEGGEVGQIEV